MGNVMKTPQQVLLSIEEVEAIAKDESKGTVYVGDYDKDVVWNGKSLDVWYGRRHYAGPWGGAFTKEMLPLCFAGPNFRKMKDPFKYGPGQFDEPKKVFVICRKVVMEEFAYIEGESLEEVEAKWHSGGLNADFQLSDTEASGPILIYEKPEDPNAEQPSAPDFDETALLRKQVKILRESLADCIEWDSIMGKHSAKCWVKARAALRAIKWRS
jgi:hypothetical protein